MQGFVAFVLATIALVVARAAFAEDVAVPVGLQAELIAKIASYDKSFVERAGERAQIAILLKGGSADSSRTAAHMQSSLAALPAVGGLPHDEHMVTYAGGGALAAYVKARRIAIVYVTPGFGEDAGDIRASLEGVNVLSVAAVPEYVPKGIVLGFDLVSGKPKLLVNLAQAKKQNVAFKAEVLKMMKVYE